MTEADVKLTTYSMDPPAKHDSPNPDTRMIGFEIALAAHEKAVVAVFMQPGESQEIPSAKKLKDIEQ